LKVALVAGPFENFTTVLDSKGSQGTLKMSWGNVEATIPVMAH